MSTRSICIRWAKRHSQQIVFTGLMLVLAGCASETPTVLPVTVGIVSSVSGSPAIVRKSQQYLIGARSRIFEGDVVQTDRFSVVRIELIDGSALVIGRESRLVFNRFDLPSAHLTLTGGAIRLVPAAAVSGRETRLELQTPVATIYARGSELMGGFISSENTLDVGLIKGSQLEVSNLHGAVAISTPGEGTTVIGGTAPQVSRRWTPGKIERTLREMESQP